MGFGLADRVRHLDISSDRLSVSAARPTVLLLKERTSLKRWGRRRWGTGPREDEGVWAGSCGTGVSSRSRVVYVLLEGSSPFTSDPKEVESERRPTWYAFRVQFDLTPHTGVDPSRTTDGHSSCSGTVRDQYQRRAAGWDREREEARKGGREDGKSKGMVRGRWRERGERKGERKGG